MIKELAIFALTDPATQWLALTFGVGFALIVGLPLGTLLAKLFGGRDD